MANENFSGERKRFETSRTASDIPLLLRRFIWTLIDEMSEKKEVRMDYRQNFRLMVEKDGQGNDVQIIRHSQEQPEYEKTYRIAGVEEPIEAKLWCTDDGTAIVLV